MAKIAKTPFSGRALLRISTKIEKISFFVRLWLEKITHFGRALVRIKAKIKTIPVLVRVWYCLAAVERLPAFHYRVDFIFLSFGIMGFLVEL